MSENKEITFNLRMLDIKVIQFSQFDLIKEFDKIKFPLVEYQTDLNFRVIEVDDKITCLANVKIKILETNEFFAELKVETNFNVSPLNLLAKLVDGKYDVNSQLLHSLGSISLSTIRGILFEKLKGSIIQNEIYPLTDLSKVFLENKN
jgi:hypothetical protein